MYWTSQRSRPHQTHFKLPTSTFHTPKHTNEKNTTFRQNRLDQIQKLSQYPLKPEHFYHYWSQPLQPNGHHYLHLHSASEKIIPQTTQHSYRPKLPPQYLPLIQRFRSLYCDYQRTGNPESPRLHRQIQRTIHNCIKAYKLGQWVKTCNILADIVSHPTKYWKNQFTYRYIHQNFILPCTKQSGITHWWRQSQCICRLPSTNLHHPLLLSTLSYDIPLKI